MTTKVRNFLIVGGVLATIVIGLIGVGLYKVYSFFSMIGCRSGAATDSS